MQGKIAINHLKAGKKMLQKLEDIYLGILRVFVIVISGLLLMGAIIFGLSSLKGFGDGPERRGFTPNVKYETIKEDIASNDIDSTTNSTRTAPQKEAGNATTQQEAIDPNKKHYEKAADIMGSFVKSVDEVNSLDKESVVGILQQRAKSYNTRLTSVYASGLPQYFDNMLSDNLVIEKARQEGAFEMLNQVLNAYTDEFNRQLDEENARLAEEQREHRQDQANALTNLYVAGGAFGGFLLIVFLSIFIKIERNLRNIKPISS
ncbi:hypothetical protein ACFO0E_13730 [Chromohalobacter beijerinckii]|uniref:Four helix bundle sensory module for signal transduction n=3 Tax=Chromohalobacter TaxID=42054 RepID=A0ABV8XH16_9GAMM|nr:hypothetical protein [Chromohalobacter beijerinckii]MCK0764763.1 hypothetical protein [Chromohalobacter beijerinckii]